MESHYLKLCRGLNKTEPLWTIDWLHKSKPLVSHFVAINQEAKALKTKRSPGILSLINKGNHKRSVSLVLNLKTKQTGMKIWRDKQWCLPFQHNFEKLYKINV